MYKHTTRLLLLALFCIFTCISTLPLYSGHNTSRYFHFLEKPANTTVQSRWYVSPSVFFTTASTAFDREGGNAGIPELFGKYDLNDVIASLAAVRAGQGLPFTNPFLTTSGVEALAGKSIQYAVDGKIRSGGVFLDGAVRIFSPHLYFGFNIGLFRVETSNKYTLIRTSDPNDFEAPPIDPLVEKLLPGEINQVERVRLAVHREMCLKPGDWDATGFTDLDLYLRFHHFWDHKLMFRGINFNVIGGVVVPTSTEMPLNFPASAPLMGNGHWGFYIDVHPEIELKPDWHVGLMLSFMFQASSTDCRRIPVFKEPASFSALVGNLRINPGNTLKASPYIEIKNIVDGLHLHGRYTYLRHDTDSWRDRRASRTTQSLFTREPEDTETGFQELCEAVDKHVRRTSWRSHYFTLGLHYEPAEAQMKWFLDPEFFIHYDIPLDGKGTAKTHQIWLGAEFRF